LPAERGKNKNTLEKSTNAAPRRKSFLPLDLPLLTVLVILRSAKELRSRKAHGMHSQLVRASYKPSASVRQHKKLHNPPTFVRVRTRLP
jgi:hypothetical protein